VIRFPKGDVGPAVDAVRREGSVDVLHETSRDSCDLLLVGVGAFAAMAVEIAGKLEAQGHSVTAVDPRWVLPVSDDLVGAARAAGAVAVVEDNLVSCGIGAAVTVALRDAGLDIAEAPSSRKDLAVIQGQMNRWAGETGLPYTHLSRILAMSIGENRSLDALKRRMNGEE
jgi:deoxyxylulose-5-phosphate synthase